MHTYSIRPAALSDGPFLAESIIEAEKSNTDKAGLSTLFEISEEALAQLIVNMLEEEIDGCDYAVSSFLIAETNGKPVAAVAGWVEELEGEAPSHQLRSNLFGFTFPEENILAFQQKKSLVGPLQIDRQPGTLQIEHVYVHPDHRGRALAGRLIEAHIARALRDAPGVTKAEIQLVANNTAALRSYEKLGFRLVRTYRTDDPKVLDLLPDNTRLLLEKELNKPPA